MITKEQQVTKEEFRRLYVQYGQSRNRGWTQEYWDHFFENETSMKYVFTKPNSSTDDVMCIGGEKNTHRIYFLSEDALEGQYGHE
jgi:hypothetical protein